ncbi:uncharacterized protein Thert_02308 [Thermoanaerobacterium thermosaccharolyticum]|uniref:Uncharacterized protein n=1 Tax=Thermoanaerobacterium thermosaccharolyticum TaxID=1517 RepID=A0A223I0H4_THETR|nr:uncharacterized protein Thert_02308 [Thermoanaerobacterium thermosaccharolyticum]
MITTCGNIVRLIKNDLDRFLLLLFNWIVLYPKKVLDEFL